MAKIIMINDYKNFVIVAALVIGECQKLSKNLSLTVYITSRFVPIFWCMLMQATGLAVVLVAITIHESSGDSNLPIF